MDMNITILSKVKKNKNKTANYYLTDNIIVRDRKIYVEKEKNDKSVLYKINKNNWHKYLNEYGWDKLELSWQKRVKFNYNYPFGFLDCGGGGDCLFSVISEALNLEDIYNNGDGNKYSIETIRGFASKEVKSENYENILNIYKALFDNNDFDGEWNPYDINNIEELRKIISTNGDKYWGDHICLDLLQRALDINFILMKTDFGIETDDSKYFYPICQDINENTNYIIIYYTDEIHFQLVGYFDGNLMRTVFSYDNLPTNFVEMYKRDMNKSWKK